MKDTDYWPTDQPYIVQLSEAVKHGLAILGSLAESEKRKADALERIAAVLEYQSRGSE